MKAICFLLLTACLLAATAFGQSAYQTDRIPTAAGDLTITFLGHGSLLFTTGGRNLYIDPVSRYIDFAHSPKADLILVTHQHGDHLDSVAIEKLRTDKTIMYLTQACAPSVRGGTVMENGAVKDFHGITISAVPAYNLEHKRPDGTPFHPKGMGNGYVLTIGGKRFYIAGDTENVPEMSELGTIECAFLPMNLPYTMTPEMVAEAARRIKPHILYPYHFGKTDPQLLVNLLKDAPKIEIRIRNMQ